MVFKKKGWKLDNLITRESIAYALDRFYNGEYRDSHEISLVRRELDLSYEEPVTINVSTAEETEFLSNFYTDIMKIKTNFEITNPKTNKEIRKQKVLVLKSYSKENGDDNGTRSSREARVLSALSQRSKRVPNFYHYDDHRKTIYMSGIDGINFNKLFDSVEDSSRKVLRHIMNRHVMPKTTPTFKSELREVFLGGVDEVIRDLEDRALIIPVEKTVLESDKAYLPTSFAFERFDRNGEDDLREKSEFGITRDKMVKSAIVNLIEVQKVGNEQYNKIKNVIPSPGLVDCISDDMAMINYIVNFYTKRNGGSCNVFSQTQKLDLERVLRDINIPLLRLIDTINPRESPFIQFSQGDAYSANHLVEGNYVYLIDFDKSTYSFLWNDIIDFLNSIHLFAGVKDAGKYYGFALMQKKSKDKMTLEQISMGDKYTHALDDSLFDLLPLAKIKRSLRTVGTLSKVIDRNSSYDDGDEDKIITIKKYEKIREIHYNHLLSVLNLSHEGSKLRDILLYTTRKKLSIEK